MRDKTSVDLQTGLRRHFAIPGLSVPRRVLQLLAEETKGKKWIASSNPEQHPFLRTISRSRYPRQGKWELVATQYYDRAVTRIAWDEKNQLLYAAEARGNAWGFRVDLEAVAAAPASKDGQADNKLFKLIKSFEGLHSGRVSEMVVDDRKQYLVTSSFDKTLKVQELGDPERASAKSLISEFKHKYKIKSFVYESKNSRCIVGASDHKIHIVDVSANPGEILVSFSGHTGSVNALHNFPAGRYLFSGGASGGIGLWTLKPPKDVMMSDRIGLMRVGPRSDITAIQFVKSAKWIITGHAKGFVAVINAENGKCLMVFHNQNGANTSPVTHLEWLEGPKVLMTASHDGYRFWQFPKNMIISRVVEKGEVPKLRPVDKSDTSGTVLDLEAFLAGEEKVASLDDDGDDDDDDEEENTDRKAERKAERNTADSAAEVDAENADDAVDIYAEADRAAASTAPEPKRKPVAAGFMGLSNRILTKPSDNGGKVSIGVSESLFDDDEEDEKSGDGEGAPDGPSETQSADARREAAEAERRAREAEEEKKAAAMRDQILAEASAKPKKKKVDMKKFANLFGEDASGQGGSLFGDDEDDIFG